MADSVHCYGYVLRREDGHVLRSVDFEVMGQRKKGTLKRTWKKLVKEECMMVCLNLENIHYQSKWNVGIILIAIWLR